MDNETYYVAEQKAKNNIIVQIDEDNSKNDAKSYSSSSSTTKQSDTKNLYEDEKQKDKKSSSIISAEDEFYNRFSPRKRLYMVLVISLCSITAPMTTTIVYPISSKIIDEFNTTESMVDACLSVFLILAGVVPLGWAAFSDVYGRHPVYFTSMVIFIFSCIGAILSTNMPVYFVMRCFQAIGSSAVLAIGAGSISDIFPVSVRGRAMGMYLCGPLLGPTIGPMVGGVLLDHFGWRSVFYFLTIVDILLFTLILLFLPETMRNPSPIFGRDGLFAFVTRIHLPSWLRCHREGKGKAKDENAAIVDDSRTLEAGAIIVSTESSKTTAQPTAETSAAATPKKSFPNPFLSIKYLKYPFVTLIIIYICVIYGMSYCLTSSLPKIYSSDDKDAPYQFSSTVVGFLYIGMGVGMVLGSLTGGFDSDRIIRTYTTLVNASRVLILSNYQKVISAANTAAPNSRYRTRSLNKYNSDITEYEDGEEGQRAANTTLPTPEQASNSRAKIIGEKRKRIRWVPSRIPPELRLKHIYYGSTSIVIGLLVHGWAVQNRLFVLIPLCGQLIVGFGQMYTFSITSTYLIEVFPTHSASITSLNNCLRSIFAAVTTYLYSPAVKYFNGTGMPFTILAILIAVGFVGIFYVFIRGTYLRQKHSIWRNEYAEDKREMQNFEKDHGMIEGSIIKYFS